MAAGASGRVAWAWVWAAAWLLPCPLAAPAWAACGDVCRFDGFAPEPTAHYPFLRKRFDCPAILHRLTLGFQPPKLPPKRPPPTMRAAYTQGGQLEVDFQYRRDIVTARATHWDVAAVYRRVHRTPGVCLPEELPYRQQSCWLWEMLRKHRRKVLGRRGLVVGSRHPWVESMLLGLGEPDGPSAPRGAAEVVTVEYGRILHGHPNLTTLQPREAAEQYARGQWRPVDFAVSFSSVEHSGLGRYGDPLLPHADLEAVAQIWCLCRPNCTLFLGVPTHRHRSVLVFNLHRLHGPQRLQHLTANWRVVEVHPPWDRFTNYTHLQPTWVLRKVAGL